jgi:glycerol-3-phosphate acyltransferase PlsY
MDWQIAVLAAAAGYLIGALSFARLVTHLVAPQANVSGLEMQRGAETEHEVLDITSATTVGMRIGAGYGKLAGIGDMLKVIVPALGLRLLYPGQPYFLICAVAGMIGHIWPVYHRFKGGRGLSAAVGGMLVLDPLGVLVAWILGIVFGFALRSVFLIYFGGLWLFIPLVWLHTANLNHLLFALLVNTIFIAGMIPEIKMIARDYREGKQLSFDQSMQLTPMSRQMHKMAQQWRVIK